MRKLVKKIVFEGKIEVITGLYIGGSDVDLDIGGLDSEVIKVSIEGSRIPYIPGSSLKGKMRSLLSRLDGTEEPNKDKPIIKSLFGATDKNFKENTRLIFRDNFVIDNKYELEMKSENTITRSTGRANPRHTERVVKASLFRLDMVLDVYESDDVEKFKKIIKNGFKLLMADYLGGSGTRGYGKIKFDEITTETYEYNGSGGDIEKGKKGTIIL